jgi:molybdopterin converting factor small subunit
MTMRTRVSFFAVLREIAGVAQADLDLPEGCTIGDLKQVILNDFPQLAGGMESAIVAIDQVVSDPDQLVKPDMDISIFPPIAGG